MDRVLINFKSRVIVEVYRYTYGRKDLNHTNVTVTCPHNIIRYTNTENFWFTTRNPFHLLWSSHNKTLGCDGRRRILYLPHV